METSWTCTARRLVDSRLSSPGFLSSYSFFFFFCFFFPYTTVSLDWRNDCSLYIHFRFLNPMALQPTRIAGLYRHAAHSSFSPSIFFSSSSILDPVGSIFHPSSFLYVYPFFGPEDPSSISHSLVHYYTTSSKQRLYIYTGQKYVYLCTAVHRYIFTFYIFGGGFFLRMSLSGGYQKREFSYGWSIQISELKFSSSTSFLLAIRLQDYKRFFSFIFSLSLVSSSCTQKFIVYIYRQTQVLKGLWMRIGRARKRNGVKSIGKKKTKAKKKEKVNG